MSNSIPMWRGKKSLLEACLELLHMPVKHHSVFVVKHKRELHSTIDDISALSSSDTSAKNDFKLTSTDIGPKPESPICNFESLFWCYFSSKVRFWLALLPTPCSSCVSFPRLCVEVTRRYGQNIIKMVFVMFLCTIQRAVAHSNLFAAVWWKTQHFVTVATTQPTTAVAVVKASTLLFIGIVFQSFVELKGCTNGARNECWAWVWLFLGLIKLNSVICQSESEGPLNGRSGHFELCCVSVLPTGCQLNSSLVQY